MPTAAYAEDSSRHAKGQMGNESYFKSPQKSSSKLIDGRKDLLGYFKKVPKTPGIKPQVEKQPRDNTTLADDEEIAVIIPENSKIENVPKDETRKDPHKNDKKKNGLWKNTFKGSDEKTDRKSVANLEISECYKSDIVNVCKDSNSNQGMYVSEVSYSEILHKSVGQSVKNFEKSHCHDKKKAASSADNADNALLSSEVAKKKNVFTFMMANRGKQNDILKEMAAYENCDKGSNLAVGKLSSPNICEKQDITVIPDESVNEGDLIDETDSCEVDSESLKKSIVTDDAKAVSSSVTSDNVFVFMMANRFKQNKQPSKSEKPEEIIDHMQQAQSDSQDKGKSSSQTTDTGKKRRETSDMRKRKNYDDLDSSLQDFELTPKIGTQKKRKCFSKKFGHHPEEETIKTHDTFETGLVNPACPSKSHVDTVVEEVKFIKSISFTDFMKAAAADRKGEVERKDGDGGSIKVFHEAQQKINECLESHISINSSGFHETVVKDINVKNRSKGKKDVNKDDGDFHKTDVKDSVNNTIKQDKNDVSKDDYDFHKTDIKNSESTDEIKQERKSKKRNSLAFKKNSHIDARSSAKEDRVTDIKNISQTGKKEVPSERLIKRSRKKFSCLTDSDDDSVTKEAATSCDKESGCITTSEKRIDSTSQQGYVDCSKKSGISKFFKKISQEEKAVERSKNVFTVKADVHAPHDGLEGIVGSEDEAGKSTVYDMSHFDATASNKENISGNSCEKRSSRRLSKRITKNQELEDLNKIELLEQITLTASPKKDPVNSLKMTSIVNVDEVQQKHKTTENLKELKLCNEATKPEELNLSASKQKELENEKKKHAAKKVLGRMSQDQDIDRKKVIKERKMSKYEASCSGEAKVLGKEGTLEENPRIQMSKETQIPKMLQIKESDTRKGNSSLRRSLRRKRPASIEFEEEKSSEIISNSETIETETSDLSALESSCDISFDSPEKGETESLDCSSAEVNEDDKESIVKYTSTLIQTSKRLQLKIKRIHCPSRHKEKSKLLRLQHSNITGNQMTLKKAKKVLQKAKEIQGNNKAKRHSQDQKKKKALSDGVIGSLSKETTMQVVEHDVVIIDDLPLVIDSKSGSAKKTKRRKSSQLLLKPLPLDSSGKQNQKKKSKINSLSRKKKTKISNANEIDNARIRRSSRQAAVNAKKAIEEQRNELELEKVKRKTNENKKDMFTKEVKLAPIFCKKSKSPPSVEVVKIVTLSPTKLKARQDFLKSGVPNEIKKQLSVEKSPEEELYDWPPFPEVSHIQQRTENEALWNLGNPDIPLQEMDCENLSVDALMGKPIFHQNIMSLLEKSNHDSSMSRVHVPVLDINSLASILAYIKRMNPNFPVYTVFKSYFDMKKEAVESYKKELEKEVLEIIDLEDDNINGKKIRKRKSRALSMSKNKRSKLGGIKNKTEDKVQQQPTVPLWQQRTPHTWTQVFAPKCCNQIIGNAEHLKRLRMWLQEWKGKREVYASKKNKKRVLKRGGDFLISGESNGWEDEDFLVSDESSSWDEDDFVNTYLLSGPPGVGKTATVYALAAELGYKVLEINASSRRPGRQVMSQLAEATQSHSLSNTSAQPTSALAAMFAAKTSSTANDIVKKSAPSSLGEDSQGSGKDSEKRKGVSLVLFEDIDIVYEEWDEGFISTVNSFMATSKRPIILTVSYPSPSVLSRIKGSFEKIDFVPPPEDLTAQHLQLVCLANGHHICYKDVKSLVHINKGDIRQSLLDLQLLALSGSSPDMCNCGTHEVMTVSSTECDNTTDASKTKDLSLIDIFPGATNVKTQDIKINKAGLWGKLQASATFDVEISDLKSDSDQPWSDRRQKIKGRVSWKQMANNFSSILPLPLKEKEQKPQRYPLQSTDILLKGSCLWQRYSWLSLSDENDDQQPEISWDKEESKKNNEVPQSVENALSSCLKSMANLYDTFAQLDILEASQCVNNASAQIKDQGWWVQQPTAGLNDDLGSLHPYWAPFDIISDISHELGHRALTQCSGEITSALEELPSKDWPQLCIADDSRQGIPNLLPHFSSRDSERSSHRNIMASIASRLPPVNQLGRNIALDYLPTIRSITRHDEVRAAISKSRRGRRFLSQLAQLGFDISLEDKLKMANALIT